MQKSFQLFLKGKKEIRVKKGIIIGNENAWVWFGFDFTMICFEVEELKFDLEKKVCLLYSLCKGLNALIH